MQRYRPSQVYIVGAASLLLFLAIGGAFRAIHIEAVAAVLLSISIVIGYLLRPSNKNGNDYELIRIAHIPKPLLIFCFTGAIFIAFAMLVIPAETLTLSITIKRAIAALLIASIMMPAMFVSMRAGLTLLVQMTYRRPQRQTD